MAMKVLACLLALAFAAEGASLASLDMFDSLQELLINPEAMGARMKRDTTGQWDKEFILDILGISFQIKYNDKAHPLKGGHAHVKFPGRRFLRDVSFDDVDLDIVFNGGDYIDGLFDMKIDYKFVQKFTFLADRPQEGHVVIYRKMEGGMWKTQMSVDNNNRKPSPFFDVMLESDRKTKLHGVFKYDADNTWEVKINRVPGQSITGVFIHNGVEYNIVGTLDMASKKLNVKVIGWGHTHELDFKMTTDGEWGFLVTGDVYGPVDFKMAIKKDFKQIDFVAKYKNRNYAFVKLTGEASNLMYGMIPKKADYVMKYNVMDSQMEGKAKITMDFTSMARILKFSFVPKTGEDLTLSFKVNGDIFHAAKFEYEATRAGTTITKFMDDFKFENNANMITFDMNTDLTMEPTSIFYNFFCWKVGKCFLHGTREVKMMYNKKERNFMLGKMMFEDKSMVDGHRFQEKKLDTRTTPYTMMWYQPDGPSWMPNTHTMFNLDTAELKVWHKIGQELKIETNVDDMHLTIRRVPDYFVEFIRLGETLLKTKTDVTPAMFITEIDTIFYVPSNSIFQKMFCMYGKGCFTKREGHMRVEVDRVNKNALINKFSIDSTIKKDNTLALEMHMSTMNKPYTFKMNAPYLLPKFFGDRTRKTIEATIKHDMGSKLEIDSNCPEFAHFEITTAGSHRTVVLNGKELMVVDYTSGQRHISQTTELPSGEHLTTKVEWTKDTMRNNKAILTVNITPNREFKGVIDWDMNNMKKSKFSFDIKGRNPFFGDYAITRKGDWHITPSVFIFNWNGKTNFSEGPLAVVSPMDTFFHFNFDKSYKTLDADMTKTVGGKKWGVTISNNRFNLLAGAAA